MIAVTQTLSTWGGTFYVSKGLGFLYNNHLRSSRTDARRVRQPGAADAIEHGERADAGVREDGGRRSAEAGGGLRRQRLDSGVGLQHHHRRRSTAGSARRRPSRRRGFCPAAIRPIRSRTARASRSRIASRARSCRTSSPAATTSRRSAAKAKCATATPRRSSSTSRTSASKGRRTAAIACGGGVRGQGVDPAASSLAAALAPLLKC